MRISATTTALALALALAACGDKNGANDMTTEATVNDAAINAALGPNDMTDANMGMTMPTNAAGFAAAAAATDLYEIESATLAADKSTAAEIKEVAGHIKADHQRSAADLKALASKNSITVEPALDAEKQRMLDELKAASGADFDRLFLEQQKTAHQKALALLQGYSSGGGNAAFKAFAAKGAPIVKGHLDHLNTIELK